MTRENISLGEFVKQLTVRIHERDWPMPFKEEGQWHLLFYQFKREGQRGRPAFFDQLRFDWDGPYPRSQELSDYIHALHFTGCVAASNPSYDRLSLNDRLGALWSSEKLEGDLSEFMDYAMGLVEKQFAGQKADARSLSNT
jgi:hypothetical protein